MADDIVRGRSNHSQLLSRVHLFLIDEVSCSCDVLPHSKHCNQVHIVNESRGSTLEVVICRMKMRGSAVRFVAVSATVPNIDDVAHWIASRYSNGAAASFQVS
jgi:ATP-dependent DNA helicase HFM1/MER3